MTTIKYPEIMLILDGDQHHLLVQQVVGVILDTIWCVVARSCLSVDRKMDTSSLSWRLTSTTPWSSR